MDYDKIPISEPIFLPDKEEKRNSGAGIMNDYKIMNKGKANLIVTVTIMFNQMNACL